MKRWAWLTAGLYVLALTVLAGPFIYISFIGEVHIADAPSFYVGLLIYVLPIFVVMGLIHVALLAVRVPAAQGRPIKRGHVFWTLFACVVAIALLLTGGVAAIGETIGNTKDISAGLAWSLICIPAGIWLVWTFLFAFYAGRKPAEGLLAHVCKWLIAGSILELLIAVPTHIIARCRNYCCAGFLTGLGLATGTAVMLLAFGPAVFALFIRRYASVKPNLPAASDKLQS